MDSISKIQKFHYSKLHFSLLTVLFAPISILYFVFISLKNFFYEIGLLKSKKADIRVICVGNLTTGGVGKTPVVIEIANYLAECGERPAIVTRGYKGKLSNSSVNIIRDFNTILINDPELSGDEPNLIANSVKNVAVLVGKNRYNLAQYAKAMGATVVITDDGFTNRKLYKDQTILLFDYEKFKGNGCLLPLGPLREPMNEIKRADKIIVVNKTGKSIALDSELVKNLKFKDISILNVVPDKVVNLKNGAILEKNKKVVAFTGIGSPSQFFNFLQDKCNVLKEYTYPDHHDYSEGDISYIVNSAKKLGADVIVVTKKDYVKIKDFDFCEFEVYVLELKLDLDIKGILKCD